MVGVGCLSFIVITFIILTQHNYSAIIYQTHTQNDYKNNIHYRVAYQMNIID